MYRHMHVHTCTSTRSYTQAHKCGSTCAHGHRSMGMYRYTHGWTRTRVDTCLDTHVNCRQRKASSQTCSAAALATSAGLHGRQRHRSRVKGVDAGFKSLPP